MSSYLEAISALTPPLWQAGSIFRDANGNPPFTALLNPVPQLTEPPGLAPASGSSAWADFPGDAVTPWPEETWRSRPPAGTLAAATFAFETANRGPALGSVPAPGTHYAASA